MAKNTVPEAKDALNRFKMEAASEVGVNLKQGYNGDLTSKQAGSVGGQMVKKMIKAYEESMRQFDYQKSDGRITYHRFYHVVIQLLFDEVLSEYAPP